MSAIRTVDPPTKYISAVRAGGGGKGSGVPFTSYQHSAPTPDGNMQLPASCGGAKGPSHQTACAKALGPGTPGSVRNSKQPSVADQE